MEEGGAARGAGCDLLGLDIDRKDEEELKAGEDERGMENWGTMTGMKCGHSFERLERGGRERKRR